MTIEDLVTYLRDHLHRIIPAESLTGTTVKVRTTTDWEIDRGVTHSEFSTSHQVHLMTPDNNWHQGVKTLEDAKRLLRLVEHHGKEAALTLENNATDPQL